MHMNNPYWQPEDKAHVVDPDEVRRIAFEIFNIVMASASLAGDGVEPDEDEGAAAKDRTPIANLHFEMAETELSKNLLRLSMLMRSLDDYFALDADDAYSQKLEEINAGNDIGTLDVGERSATLPLREAFNKIIHARDVRPVYDSDDERDDPKARWGMDGEIELRGSHRGADWVATLNVTGLLDAVVELVDFVDEED